MLRSLVFFVLLLSGVVVGAWSPAHAEKRIGLVIGNNDYPRLKTVRDPGNGQLAKAVADAEAMGETLRLLGFDVVIGRNVDRVTFLTLLDSVKRKIEPGDTVFVFFAGHGVAFRGANLLLPSDIPAVDPEGEQLIRGLAVAETDIIDAVREKGAGLTIVALDACRDNPIEQFAREQARIQGRSFRSVSMRSVGLETRPTSGVFSIYSAGIGQKALDGLPTDGAERNSVFTRVFIRKVREPGRHLADVMEDVKEEVANLAASTIDPDTQRPHRQAPAYYNETLGGRVFLAGRPAPAAPDTRASEIAALQEKLRAIQEQLVRKDEPKPGDAKKDEPKIAAITPQQAAPPPPAATTLNAEAPLAAGRAGAPAAGNDGAGIGNFPPDGSVIRPSGSTGAPAGGDKPNRFALRNGSPDLGPAIPPVEKSARRNDSPFGPIIPPVEGESTDIVSRQTPFLVGPALDDYRAAKSGNVAAMVRLAQRYCRGDGARFDANEASRWFGKAEALGSKDAARLKPSVCRDKIKDERISIDLSHSDGPALMNDLRLANAGNADAMFRVGDRYCSGSGAVEGDIDEAKRWYDKAQAASRLGSWKVCKPNARNTASKSGSR